MGKPYTHIEPGEEIRSISGYFSLEKEIRMVYEGRDVFYAVGAGIVETSCCGLGGVRYALVPGEILSWKGEVNLDGQEISQVEPITDTGLQERLAQFIKKKEMVTQVNFLA